MFQKQAVFGLVMFTGAAIAGPVGGLVNGLTAPLLSAGPAASASSARGLPALPAFGASGRSAFPTLVSPQVLPGLGLASATKEDGPLGATVLQDGADGSGYGYVLRINDFMIIEDELDNVLVTPLLGMDGDNGDVDVAVFDGNNTARPASDGLAGFAVGSFDNTGNGGMIGLGVANGHTTGNGGEIGIAALSGTHSGNGGSIGVGILNENDTGHLCLAGECFTSNDLAVELGASPHQEASGIAIGGGPNGPPVSSSNPGLNVGLITGDNAGSGGMIGVAVIAGDDSAQADLLGVCVLCGDRSGAASIGVAALSGNDSGLGVFGEVPLGIGVGVLNKNNSGSGQDAGVGAINGNNAGNGGILGVGAINGSNSGNGGDIGVGAINGNDSGGGGALGVGALNGPGAGGGGGGPVTGTPPGGGGNPAIPGSEGGDIGQAQEADGQCAIVVKDVKGRVTQIVKRACERIRVTRQQLAVKI